MASDETHTIDRRASSSQENPNPSIGESVAPERKKSKHHPPFGEGVLEPHSPFDADQAESDWQLLATDGEAELQTRYFCAVGGVSKELPAIKTEELVPPEDSGRERLKRYRVEVAGSVWIPDIWGQEERMKDWIDCSVFDASLVSSRITSARAALMAEGTRPSSSGLRIGNRWKIYS